METTEAELRGGVVWLCIAGGAGVLLTLALWCIDTKLTYSNVESVRGKTLHELRTAQSTLGSHNLDVRQTTSYHPIEGGNSRDEGGAPEEKESAKH